MSKVKFGQYLTVDKEIYKICPKCRRDIKPEWVVAYKNEWCPACGLNLDIQPKEDSK